MRDIAIKEIWHLSKEYQNENIKVYFIGDVISGKNFKLEPHRNPGYEICMIPYGRGFFSINNEKEDIAKYFEYSKSYLSRIFKKETGFTIS